MLVGAVTKVESDAEVQRFRVLYQLLASLSKARVLEDVYDAALANLLEGTSADRAAILLFDDDGVMRCKASRGLSEAYLSAVTGHCPWSRGVRDAHPLAIPDVAVEPSLAALQEALRREHIAALAFLPLALDAGVFGKLMLYYAEPHECTAAEIEIAEAIAAHVALATQHKRAELARVQTEQRLQAILDNSAAVIFLKDREGKYLLVNRRFEELFGIPGSDILGRTDHAIFPPEIADQFQANDRAVLSLC